MTTISVDQLSERINAGEQLHILDVREPHENIEFNIGGTLVPLGKIKTMQLDEIEDWKNDEIIVYCRSGNRSGQACLILEAAGFQNVKNLIGGMLHWREKFSL
jgi:rhodanese-related sulfurtransferase